MPEAKLSKYFCPICKNTRLIERPYCKPICPTCFRLFRKRGGIPCVPHRGREFHSHEKGVEYVNLVLDGKMLPKDARIALNMTVSFYAAIYQMRKIRKIAESLRGSPVPTTNNLSYSRGDLICFLREQRNKEKDKDILCKFSGNAIGMLVQFVCEKNGIPRTITDVALKIFEITSRKNCFAGKQGTTVAAALVYYASRLCFSDSRCLYVVLEGKERKLVAFTQHYIASVFIVTPVTVRYRCKDIDLVLSDEDKAEIQLLIEKRNKSIIKIEKEALEMRKKIKKKKEKIVPVPIRPEVKKETIPTDFDEAWKKLKKLEKLRSIFSQLKKDQKRDKD